LRTPEDRCTNGLFEGRGAGHGRWQEAQNGAQRGERQGGAVRRRACLCPQGAAPEHELRLEDTAVRRLVEEHGRGGEVRGRPEPGHGHVRELHDCPHVVLQGRRVSAGTAGAPCSDAEAERGEERGRGTDLRRGRAVVGDSTLEVGGPAPTILEACAEVVLRGGDAVRGGGLELAPRERQVLVAPDAVEREDPEHELRVRVPCVGRLGDEHRRLCDVLVEPHAPFEVRHAEIVCRCVVALLDLVRGGARINRNREQQARQAVRTSRS